MKLIRVSSAVSGPEAEAKFKGQRFDESALDFVARDEDTTVLKPDGSVLLVYLKRVLPAGAIRAAHPVLREIEAPPVNRQVTVIGKSYNPTRLDGVQSRTNYVSPRENPELRRMSSGIIGYYDRSVRMPYCRATAFNLKSPEKFATCLPLFQAIDRVFARALPERHAAQAARARSTHAAWVIPGTTFTTVTVNRNYDAACHLDAGDLKEGFGVMSALRSGIYEGGVTYWPGYRVGAFMDTGDVCLADVHEWHGVSSIRGTPGRYERVSIVLYHREKMCRCLAPPAELEQAKNRKLGDPLYPGAPEPEADDEADAAVS